jgi:hypothetical protein
MSGWIDNLFEKNGVGIPTPARVAGIPVCSTRDCPLYATRVEAGWGIYSQCYGWSKKKDGPKPHYFGKNILCKPFTRVVLSKVDPYSGDFKDEQ